MGVLFSYMGLAEVATTPDLDPVLWTASRDGRTEEVRQLLVDGANMEEKGGGLQSTALTAAVESGRLEIAIMLMDAGADVDATDAHGRTALHTGVCLGPCFRVDVARRLLAAGADVDGQDEDGKTALHTAVELSRAGPPPNPQAEGFRAGPPKQFGY